MTTADCKHWYTEEDKEKSITYCKDCLVIMSVFPTWSAKIKIGKMETYFTQDGETLDLKDMIEMSIGSDIALENLRFTSEKWYRPDYFVSFSIGKSTMYADIIDLSKGTRNEPTGRYYEKPEVVEEEVEA